MGNCLKRDTIISDKYLFEPLKSTDEDDEENYNFGMNSNECVNKRCKYSDNNSEIENLSQKLADLDRKINILDQNTRENFKTISEDIHYINEKHNKTSSE